jgi:alpha-methylacyl-CoA racemase
MGQGPIAGLRVLEFAGVGPGPFAAMLLSDLGADVVRVDRPGAKRDLASAVLDRGRRSVALDLKRERDLEVCLALIDRAEVLIEGYRPGVMERLGLGPAVALQRNPRLVYGRVTGYGQSGPLARAAGHDINYIALSGALHAIGTAERPSVPLNLLGDFAGGGLYVVVGVLAAVLHARATGNGQIVDAAMSDGSASLMGAIFGLRAAGHWSDQRADNILDGAAPFYGVYQCSDGRWLALGALEDRFYLALIRSLGLRLEELPSRDDRSHWSELRSLIAAQIRTRTRAQWCEALADTDACVAPVLSLDEAPLHPHNRARGTFVEVDGMVQPAPQPQFSATPGGIQGPAPETGQGWATTLASWGVSAALIATLEADDAARPSPRTR